MLAAWRDRSSGSFYRFPIGLRHRRRMGTEAKAKVVASVWRADFVQFLAAFAVLPQSIWKNRLNSSYFSKSTETKLLARQGIEQNLHPQTDAMTFAFASVYILLLCLQGIKIRVLFTFQYSFQKDIVFLKTISQKCAHNGNQFFGFAYLREFATMPTNALE